MAKLYFADRVEYSQLLGDWLRGYKETSADDYGGPEPKLYAYGHGRRPAAMASLLTEFDSMEAIATRIPPDDGSPSLSGARQILVFFTEYHKDLGWAITGVSLGNSEPFLTEYLNQPVIPLERRIFEFWSPWPPLNATLTTP